MSKRNVDPFYLTIIWNTVYNSTAVYPTNKGHKLPHRIFSPFIAADNIVADIRRILIEKNV